ncbi:uncharacterized WD repeat-containing protein C2A9.03-like isoform X2 [Asparagus officinalis]|uniref:uncharacterized WD repeat-containing protein C2A9.03-like isoform X2 n=1 Tax=Asparagus officinalis TaxID=4686 RepID=UPI00098E78B0|nr:uncharacterized WD repeat-containing protein C2A9.03-like isoform X2 [Asparagus officinalis]
MMAQYLNDDLEYVADDYFDTAEFDDDEFGYSRQQREAAEFSDFEGDIDSKTDTSAYEFRKGKDMQGIPWERLNYSRDKFREMRLKQYKNYESLPRSRDSLEKEYQEVKTGGTFYDFQFNTRLVKPTVVHFQLRNLLWATSKHDVYMMENYSVMHWSSLLRRGKEVLNVSGKIVPTQKYGSSCAHPLSRVQISTMVVKDNLIVAGGFQGELIYKYLNNPGVAFCGKVTNENNAITNAVDVYCARNGSLRVMTANNDCYVRIFDANNFALLNRLSYSWSINSTSVSPDGKFLAVLGDNTDCLIADAQSGKMIGNLKGHLDYSFSSAWHPDSHILATGNQDKTCRLWDIRKLSESLAVLKGRMGAIRGIKFSADGRFMAMAEPADFVHVFDVGAGYCEAQEIDLFGEIAGISFSPDTEALFVGIADRTYGSLLEFRRRHQYQYTDSFL